MSQFASHGREGLLLSIAFVCTWGVVVRIMVAMPSMTTVMVVMNRSVVWAMVVTAVWLVWFMRLAVVMVVVIAICNGCTNESGADYANSREARVDRLHWAPLCIIGGHTALKSEAASGEKEKCGFHQIAECVVQLF